jgi:hypothetical protein
MKLSNQKEACKMQKQLQTHANMQTHNFALYALELKHFRRRLITEMASNRILHPHIIVCYDDMRKLCARKNMKKTKVTIL